jgi:cytochrome c-type biogenesis protein CcmH
MSDFQQTIIEIGKKVKCLSCKGQTIDASSSPSSLKLREIIKEKLLAGEKPGAILESFRKQYGEEIMVNPQVTLSSIFFWALPLLFLIVMFTYILRKK